MKSVLVVMAVSTVAAAEPTRSGLMLGASLGFGGASACNGCEGMVLVGIKRRGVPLADRLAKLISTIEKCPVERGVLDIQFYRDDLSTAFASAFSVSAIGSQSGGRIRIRSIADLLLLMRLSPAMTFPSARTASRTTLVAVQG